MQSTVATLAPLESADMDFQFSVASVARSSLSFVVTFAKVSPLASDIRGNPGAGSAALVGKATTIVKKASKHIWRRGQVEQKSRYSS